MKRLFAFILSCLTVAIVSAADSPSPSTFELRPVVDAASTNSEEMTISSTLPNGESRKQVMNVEKTVLLDATALESAAAVKDELGHTQISVTLNDTGKEKFAGVSTEYIGKKIGVIINGRLYCAPVVRSPITGGKLQIAGSFTEQEAKELAAKLNEAVRK